jgi:hypothetical protein
MADRPGAAPEVRTEAQAANLAAREALAAAAQNAAAAREALMEEHGERGTAWFHRLAVDPDQGSRDPILQLRVPGSAEPVSLAGPRARDVISQAATAHFSSDSPHGLFAPQPTCPAAQATLLSALDARLPPALCAAAEGEASGELTEAELRAALSSTSNGRAPGSDGLPYEVYKSFWPLLGPRLTAAAAAVFSQAAAAPASAADSPAPAPALPPSWREGIITPIYKGKGLDPTSLASYRPITLQNCDWKLVSKAVASRLQPALDAVIDPVQTAFIRGRWIGDNVLFHQGLADWLELDVGADGQPQQGAALLCLDIEKAYDRVSRPWLHATVAALGFGPHMQLWCRLLTAPSTACLHVNGTLSDPFPVRSGLPQGSPASPPLWVLQLQPLSAHLRRLVATQALRTPRLPSGQPAPPVHHHADDTKLLVSDPAVDGPVAMAALHLFQSASAAKVHPGKSQGLGLGRLAGLSGPCPHTGVPFSAVPVTDLGLPLAASSASRTAATEPLYARRVQRMAHASRLWQGLSLSLVGRVYIAKAVLAAQLAYHLGFQPASSAQLAGLAKLLDTFTATSPHPEDATFAPQATPQLQPGRAVTVQSRSNGGMGAMDLSAFSTAMLAKPLALLAQPGRAPWKQLHRDLFHHLRPPDAADWSWIYGSAPCPSRLPPRLHAAVTALRCTRISLTPAPPPAAAEQGWRVSPDRLWVADAVGVIQAVHYTGRLLPPPPAPPPPPVTVAWSPACVLAQRKPKHLCSPAELAAIRALPPRAQLSAWPRTLALLAPDREVVVHPRGCLAAGVPLLDYTVQHVRQSLTACASSAGPLPLRPAAWPGPSSTAAGPSNPASELTQREQRWQASASDHLGLTQRRSVDWNLNHPGWIVSTSPALQAAAQAAPSSPASASTHRRPGPRQPPSSSPGASPATIGSPYSGPSQATIGSPCPSSSQGPTPRRTPRQHSTASPGPSQRAAASPSPARPPPEPPDARALRQAWSRLWASPASRQAKALTWRLQHGHLPCGLSRAAKGMRASRSRPSLGPYCPHAACQAPATFASLSHIFLTCPAYAAARAWLQQLWLAVQPTATPPPLDSPALMLGDQPAAWASYPRGPLALLWTTLRATFLQGVWAAYYSREPARQTSAALVQEAVAALRRMMRCRFTAATLSPDVLSALPTSWLTAQLKPSSLAAFTAVWASGGVLCAVTEPAGSPPLLDVRLSLHHPIPAPH